MGRILNFGSLNIDYVYKVEHFVSAGKDPAEALDTAAKASSITVSRHGAARSIPTYDELF